MKLYWAPNSRSVTIVWMLEELGVPYERVLIDIRTGAQDEPAYRAIHPMGKVPSLVDGDTTVSEQGAICVWLADRFPEQKLAPAIGDPARGDYLRWMFFEGNCIEPALTEKANGWNTKKSQVGWGSYELVVDVLDDALKDALKRDRWIMGDRFTAADVMIGSAVNFGLAVQILEKRPSFEAYQTRIAARPAFIRTQELNARASAA
jgi:glutathione S-transferase